MKLPEAFFPWATALAWSLIHSWWEGALVALTLALALCVLKSSRTRYAAGCAAMVVLVVGMGLTFARLRWPPLPAGTRIPAGNSGILLLPLKDLAPDPGSLGALTQTEPDYLPWIVPVWAFGVLVFQLRGLFGWMAARRLRRIGVCCAPEQWRSRLDGLRVRVRLTRPVVLLESCMAEVPVVIGYLRPVILVPVGLLAGLPAAQVEAILLHELAHIRRYDYLVNLLQVFMEGVLFYHPAVWWISGTMRRERENCCDDLVVRVTGGAHEYAVALTTLEKTRLPREALAATGGGLTRRVRRLLGQPERRYAGFLPVLGAGLLTATAVMAMVTWPARTVERPTVRSLTSRRVPLAASADTVMPTLLAQERPQTDTPKTIERSKNLSITTDILLPDKILFERAMRDLEKGNYLSARLTLQTLINTFGGSEYVERAKTAVADSLRRESDERLLAQAGPAGPAARAQDAIPLTKDQYDERIRQQQERLGAMMQTLSDLANRDAALAPYRKWLNEDVAYIISAEERKAFQQLNTDDERGKFVEQFWLRRDPTPGTSENEFKAEIYRRIAYTNEHFGTASIAGWRTDRGRIYIQYGPPDQLDAHPAGEKIQRPAEQGGGVTEIYPFEQWRYRFIDGIGQNVIIEFVDIAGNGEYRMTMDPNAKAIFLRPAPR